MQKRWVVRMAIGAAVAGLAACNSSTEPSLLSDAQITSDVASTSGAAAATDVANMIGDESGGAFPAAPAGSAAATDSLAITRTVTCYDSTGAVQGACNATTTDSLHVHLTIDGTVGPDTNYRGAVFQAGVHRVRNATISNLLGTETFRIHNAVGTSNDTTHFTGTIGTRDATESSVDSVVNIRFDLPRLTHPWPTSGQIIRNVSGTVKLTGATQTLTRTYTRRVTVTFPADAQGNVVLTINGSTCNLNLVTRAVTSCS